MKLKNKTTLKIILFSLIFVSNTGCKKFLDIPLPVDKVAADGAYISDNSTSSVITGILSNMSSSSVFGSTAGNPETIDYRTGLYTDELQSIRANDQPSTAFYTDNITSANFLQWSVMYKLVYNTNIAIENIRNNKVVLPNRNQWLGEALFCRAFTYFYLVGIYGDVPLALTSDYVVNNKLSRTPKAQVNQQIIADLKEAQGLLSANFRDGYSVVTNLRGRPNQFAATALLARMYLYAGDWANAEIESTKVINSTANFQLLAPNLVFLADSKETIWSITPVTTNLVSGYILYGGAIPSVVASQTVVSSFSGVSLSQSLKNTFESGDLRFTNWIKSTTTTTTPVNGVFYFPNKYKSAVPGTESNIALRYAEQYLIRAEARAHMNNLAGAATDLNAIRTRAGLPGTTASTQETMVAAVLKERQVELFTEFGHRFLDLKRTGTIDAVMGIVAPQKGGTWNSQKQIWPIPVNEITANPNLTQAPGYN